MPDLCGDKQKKKKKKERKKWVGQAHTVEKSGWATGWATGPHGPLHTVPPPVQIVQCKACLCNATWGGGGEIILQVSMQPLPK